MNPHFPYCVEVTVNMPGSPKSLAAYVDEDVYGEYTIRTQDPHDMKYRTHYRKTLRGAQSVLDRHLDSIPAPRVDIPTTGE